MKIKILILALMFVLLVPLYIALDNLTGHEQREIKTSSIVVTISTTSDWARVSFNGASIKDYKVLDKTEGLKDIIVDKTGIILNKNKDNVTETIRLVLELSIFDKKLELVTTKDYNGELIVDIDKTGRYKNNKKTLQVPITIETTSDWTKTELDGATIRNARIIDLNGSSLREPIVGTKSITLAKLNTNDTSYGRVKFLVDLSLDTPIPIVNIEKTNNGITKVNIGELTLENNQTTESIIRNIPLTIETSSNRTEVKFQGIYLRTVKPLENIPETITGLNFISLNYSHSGNSYRKASYLVDIGITANLTNVTLTKNDPGFAIVNLGTYMFANVAKDKNNNSIKYSFDPSRLPVIAVREPLFGFNQLKENKNYPESLPLRIETTSDWTEVILKDITITNAEIKSTKGIIEKPVIGTNNILIQKTASYDNSFAVAELMLQINLNENLKNEHKNTIEMTIAKGDIGATTVFTGKMGGLVNSEKIKKDPKNIKTFSIPLTETETVPETRDDVLYNPLAFSIPLFNELYRQGIEVTYTQDMHNTYTINADVLPGTNNIYLYLRRSEAIGLLSGVILSYLILIILGIYILSRERFFDFIGWSNGEYKINVKTLGLFTIKLFEKTPASSLFIFEALFMLAITPFVLMLEENYAKGTAVLAYYLLIFGILLRLVGQSGIVNRISHLQDFPIIMFLIKAMSIIIMVSSLVVAGYELGGLYGAIASFIPGLLFVVLALIYIKKHFEKGSYTAEL